MSTALLILAAGAGSRAGGALPKQYQSFGGKPVLRHTLEAFAGHPAISTTRVVIASGQEESFREAAAGLDMAPPVTGGVTRQELGHLGLEALAAEAPRKVLIHDAARPFVSHDLVERVLAGLDGHAGVVPALPVAETLKRAPGGMIAGTVDREGLWSAQTPQGFRYDPIRSAHARAAAAGLTEFTDDAAVAEWAGLEVAVVAGEPANRKLTTADDIREASRRFIEDSFGRCPDVRTGQGIDVHSFTAGDSVTLCGVRIPHHAALHGHSDADAPLHALTDAILATISEGDIGRHFPPSDDRWKKAASSIFLAHAAALLRRRGGFIANVDITIVCETPKILASRRPDARRSGGDSLRVGRACFHQGDHQRDPGLHRTRRRFGCTGDRDGASAGHMSPRAWFSRDIEQQAAFLLEECRRRRLKIASAESCSGGLLAALLTTVPGSSDVFDRGFVTYSNDAKTELLDVDSHDIGRFGAVSSEVALAMAEGAIRHSGADLAAAITGVAGPGGGTADKPVGLVHVAAVRKGADPLLSRLSLGNLDRHEIRVRSAVEALRLLVAQAGK